MMKRPTRRQVLRGAGGFALALPWLPSLFPRGAQAGIGLNQTPRFVIMMTNHGGCTEENMYPPESDLTDTMNYAGHQIRRGALQLGDRGGAASLCPVLTADGATLTPELTAKLNVIRGLDTNNYAGHHSAGAAGNFGTAGEENGYLSVPTVDQVLAWSDTYYSDLSTILQRSMVINPDNLMGSYGWSDPDNQSGNIVALPPEQSSIGLFNKIFVQEETEDPRPPVVDRILERYNSLRQSNRRLSVEDRVRLDEHVNKIDELQRKLNVAVSCGEIPTPSTDADDVPYGGTDPDAAAQYYQLFNDVIAAAFVCDTSRIANIKITYTFSTATDWHEAVAHSASQAGPQQILADSYQRVFEDVFLDLVTKLDVDEGGGETILDNSLVCWVQESGVRTHKNVDCPVVTAGSAGGAITTGHHLDYRDLGNVYNEPDGVYSETYSGLMYSQFLGSALQAMGLEPDEYEFDTYGGYGQTSGVLQDCCGFTDLHSEQVLNASGEWLPWLQS